MSFFELSFSPSVLIRLLKNALSVCRSYLGCLRSQFVLVIIADCAFDSRPATLLSPSFPLKVPLFASSSFSSSRAFSKISTPFYVLTISFSLFLYAPATAFVPSILLFFSHAPPLFPIGDLRLPFPSLFSFSHFLSCHLVLSSFQRAFYSRLG